LPLLSAGMSTRRVVLPVLISAFAMLSFAILNQELVIPEIAPDLMIPKDDPGGNNPMIIQGTYEPNLVHIEGGGAYRQNKVVRPFYCTIPSGVAHSLLHLNAE
jgi:lipopolysaccharide export system permease protein